MNNYNYKLTTEVYSLEDYAYLADITMEEAKQNNIVGAVNAVLVDKTTGYSMRVCRTLYAMHKLAIAEATMAATLAILDDYFAHLRSIGQA